jgi:hypothetical protein
MKTLKLLCLMIVVFLVGAYLGGLRTTRFMGRMQFAKPEVDMAFTTSQESQWAAMLRLGETNSAISDLEKTIGIQLQAIAGWDSVAPADEQTRKRRDGFLIDAKTYQKSYPISGADTDRVRALLATVPDRNTNSYCKSGVCRLDDLRLAKFGTITNLP